MPETRALMTNGFSPTPEHWMPARAIRQLRPCASRYLIEMLSSTLCTCFWFEGPNPGMSPHINQCSRQNLQSPRFRWGRMEESWRQKEEWSMELGNFGFVLGGQAKGRERQEVTCSCFTAVNDSSKKTGYSHRQPCSSLLTGLHFENKWNDSS